MSEVANKAKEWIAEARASSAHSTELKPEPDLKLEAPALVLNEQLEALRHCEATVTKWWPALWPVVDAALSAITTLRLADIDVGIPLFLVGKSGTGKSTVFEFIGVELDQIVVWRDTFTTASLQGHTQEVDKEDLQKRSLIKVSKDKVVITPELAWLRTGTPVHQQERYASLLQWMDGKGRISDSAVHGAIGDRSTSYPTVLLAGTTPFKQPTWMTMGMLGPRLMMFQMDKLERSVPEHKFKIAERECKAAVQAVINALFPKGTPQDKLTRTALFRLALDAGLRKGELLGLQWKDINDSCVHIQRQLMDVVDEGGEFTLDTSLPKSKSARTVHLADGTVALLREHKRQQSELKMKNRLHYVDLDLVFAQEWADHRTTHAQLGLPLSRASIGMRLKKLCAESGIKRISPHGLRHTCATILMLAGEPAVVVQERLGHADAALTLNIYTHVLPGMQQAAAKRAAALIQG